jgi:hypothetical protein
MQFLIGLMVGLIVYRLFTKFFKVSWVPRRSQGRATDFGCSKCNPVVGYALSPGLTCRYCGTTS